MARKPRKTKNKPEKINSNPKIIKKPEIIMFACDDVFNSNKIMLCDKGSGKIMPDLSKVKTIKSPNLKTCMEKAGQLQYRKCSESEMSAVKVKIEESNTKPEAQPQDKPRVITKAEEIKPSPTETKPTIEICFAQIGTNTICNQKTKEVVKVEGLSATTFDFAITDSDLVNKCQTAILGLSTDFVTCASLETSGDL